MADLYHVVLNRPVQCDKEDCAAEGAFFRMNETKEEPSNAAFDAKLVFDIDGNGLSGRYHMLLASQSLVLKQTMLREWHDDWLVPWAHYIPISLDMSELPETVRFLLSYEGQDAAWQVAYQSRMWTKRVLREVDMQIAYWRILLEYGRLLDDDRH